MSLLQATLMGLCTLLSGLSWAATWHVSPTGTDCTTCGTGASPFRTLQRAADAARAGDVVLVQPGTYPGKVLTQHHGTETQRIRFVSQTKWGAIVRTNGQQYIWTNKANYVNIEGFEMTGDARVAILNYASHTKILGNHVHHLGRADCSDWGAGDMGAAIDHVGAPTSPRTASDNDTIGNVVHDGSNHCATVPRRPGQHGIYHAYGSGVIANNIVYRMQSYGIHVWHLPVGVRIVHNLAFGNGAGMVMGGQSNNGTADDILAANNIFYDNRGAGLRLMGLYSTNVHYTNNLSFRNGTPFDENAGRRQSGTIQADPQFVNYRPTGNGDYRLLPASPAVGRGLALTLPAAERDIDGVQRPRSGADLGPFELRGSSKAPPRAPVDFRVR